MRLRSVLAQAGDQEVPACSQLLANAAQVRAPGGLGDDVEGRGLEQAADVHRLGPAVGEDAIARRPAGDHRGDAQGGGDALGQRAQVDDVPGVVVRREGSWRRGDAEVVRPVVLDQEGAVLADDLEDPLGAFGRPLGAGGVGVGRLRVEQPRAGLVERSRQLVRVRAVGARRAPARRGRPPARRPGWRPSTSATPSAAAGRRSDQRPEDRAEPALAAGQHDHVARRRAA